MLSHRGVGQLLDTVSDVQRILNPRLEVLGVLPTMFDGRTNHARAVLADVTDRYGLTVLEPPIPKSVRFAEAPAAGRSVLATAHRAKGTEAYRELAERLFRAGMSDRAGAEGFDRLRRRTPTAGKSGRRPGRDPGVRVDPEGRGVALQRHRAAAGPGAVTVECSSVRGAPAR